MTSGVVILYPFLYNTEVSRGLFSRGRPLIIHENQRGIAGMKTVFLIQGFKVAASRYRVLQYIPFVREAGIETEIFEFPEDRKGWASLRPILLESDCVFVQRKRLPLAGSGSIRNG